MHKAIPIQFHFLPAHNMILHLAMLATGSAHITFELRVGQIDLVLLGDAFRLAAYGVGRRRIPATFSQVLHCDLWC